MKRRYALSAAALICSSPAFADPRVASHFYQANEVVTIHGRIDTQSTVAFDPDERIENVAVGDSAGWQVVPNKRADLLFLKPTKPGARTNMTVVTDQRTYLFNLVSTPRVEPVYMLRFSYPAPPPKPIPAAAVTIPAAIATPAPASAPAEPDPATLDFAWTMQGDKALIPSRLFDDGHSTFLAWPRDVPLPAILTSEGAGIEGPVNYTTRGVYVIVDGVPARLILRSGKRVAFLTPVNGERHKDSDTKPQRHDAPAVDQRTPYTNIVSTAQ